MVRSVNNRNIVLAILLVILSAAPDSFGHRRPYRHRHSKAKGALIGGAAGVVGALIGGKKGVVIGVAAGAGTGA